MLDGLHSLRLAHIGAGIARRIQDHRIEGRAGDVESFRIASPHTKHAVEAEVSGWRLCMTKAELDPEFSHLRERRKAIDQTEFTDEAKVARQEGFSDMKTWMRDL